MPAPTRPAIRVGVGGWTYEPWRDNFYPAGLPHARELHYASRHLSAIEVNGTYYSSFKRDSFARWRDETPDDFVFSLKAHRFATNRRVLADAGESIERFIGSGLTALGAKLGPIVWQLPPTKRFDGDDLEAFLRLLPRERDGLVLRHVLDVRHESFRSLRYLDLARRHGVGTVFTESDDYPPLPDLTADFVYLRIMRTQTHEAHGVADPVLEGLAACARCWASGGEPEGLSRVARAVPAANARGPVARDVFVYFISGAKERAPAAAMALIARLSTQQA